MGRSYPFAYLLMHLPSRTSVGNADRVIYKLKSYSQPRSIYSVLSCTCDSIRLFASTSLYYLTANFAFLFIGGTPAVKSSSSLPRGPPCIGLYENSLLKFSWLSTGVYSRTASLSPDRMKCISGSQLVSSSGYPSHLSIGALIACTPLLNASKGWNSFHRVL